MASPTETNLLQRIPPTVRWRQNSGRYCSRGSWSWMVGWEPWSSSTSSRSATSEGMYSKTTLILWWETMTSWASHVQILCTKYTRYTCPLCIPVWCHTLSTQHHSVLNESVNLLSWMTMSGFSNCLYLFEGLPAGRSRHHRDQHLQWNLCRPGRLWIGAHGRMVSSSSHVDLAFF